MEEKMAEKENYKDLLNKGVSMRQIVTNTEQTLSKMEVVQNKAYHIIDLPSRGWTYPPESLLSSGQVKLMQPTGRNEAILSSQTLIRKGIVIDEFLKSLFVDKIDLDDLLIGDKNYLTFASRRLAYGNDYLVEIECPKCGDIQEVNINLANLPVKQTPKLFEYPKQTNVFDYVLPITQKKVLFKLNNGHLQKLMDKYIKNSNKPGLQILIRTAILVQQIDGEKQYNKILNILQNLPAKDTMALRKYIQELSPDIDLTYHYDCPNCNREQNIIIPLDVSFFWPGYNG